MPDRIESFKLVCRGGLNSNENHLDLAENEPGAATRLVNYEPSLFGGYRRLEGYSEFDPDYPEVDDGTNSAEGKVLCVAMFRDEDVGTPYVIAARKDTGLNSYSFYELEPGVGWSKMGTGTTRLFEANSREVQKIRHVQFDFGAGNEICFVDGINNAIVFDGTDWYELSSSGSGGGSTSSSTSVLVTRSAS